MQTRQFLTMTIAVLVLLIALTTPVLASNNQSNQAMNQPATLISPDPSFEIGVYPKPSSSPKQIGFGLGGDRITILEQVGSNEGDTWDYVRFENPKQVKGWIKDEFVALQESNTLDTQEPNVQKSSYGQKQSFVVQRNGYQGNQQQNYRQQNQYP